MFHQTHEIVHTRPMRPSKPSKPIEYGKPTVCFANPKSKLMDIPICKK